MIQWTTPTHTHTVSGVDLTGCDVWVSYKQNRNSIDVMASAVEYSNNATSITVELTQKQTGSFKAGTVKVQVNWVYPSGKRDAVEAKSYEMLENLMPREVSYGEQ